MAVRFIKTLLFLAAFSFMTFSVGATYLNVQGPVASQLHNGGMLNLGKVGPGESFYVLASPTTPNASGVSVSIGWDTLQAVSLPNGWSSQASPLYENPMKMKVTVAPDAASGTYNMTLRAVNVQNYSKLGNLTFTATINVTPNVFAASVTPLNVTSGVGQPVNLQVTINNTGASDDPFLINARGLPAWDVPAEVVAPHSSSKTFLYPIFIDEPGSYSFNLTINSTTSPLLKKSYGVTLVAQASLLNDYSATGQGVVLSPIIYEPVYAFMLLVNDVYHLIVK